ncbi:hypothetical protein [Nocardia xishanensis]|uniref:hypothetical protein n=1 Tax=Nocardia xishanensis TaxID=238964 RepID=UPI00082E32A6|nr:hypothetical protein [Nocardia xishanensis]
MVPAARPAAHARQLRAWGFSDFAIAAAAGIDQKAVWNIRHESYETTTIDCAARIMSVTHVPVPSQTGMKVPSVGTQRRIQALGAIGWRHDDIAALLTVSPRQVGLYAQRRWVFFETWQAIKNIYDKLSGTPGPSRLGELKARKRGYATPLAWEGRDIDHPDHQPDMSASDSGEQPDLVLVERILAGEHRGDIPKAERQAVLDHAVSNGWTYPRLSKAMNMTPQTADRALVRHRKKIREAAA